jgi:hypothetical protein
MKKNNTQNTYIDCSTQIPTESKTPDFHKNGWISPSGEFYGFDGAKHELAACYISVFKLGGDENTLKKGTYFNEAWEGWLIKKGWCSIKNLSWLGDSKPSSFKYRELTEKQKTILFDYCEHFGYNWEELTAY